MRLLLASASPRRAELLAAAGFSFEIVPADVDECPLPDETPADHVLRLSRDKVRAVTCIGADCIALGADTVVVADGCLMGKPVDDDDAVAMLRRLSGRTHEVWTGVALRTRAQEVADVARTAVRFAPLSEDEIEWYVATGEPRDKAGAYGVQGLASRFIERIDGSYTNVVGLPVSLVYRLLQQLGVTTT